MFPEVRVNRFWPGSLLVIALAVSFAVAQSSVDSTPAATTPASSEDMKALFGLMHVREQVSQVMESIARQQRKIVHDNLARRTPRLSPKDLARLDQFTIEIMQDLPVDGMIDDMIPIYQKHLNKNDVDVMTAFYSTPTGQKLVREMPAMTVESMQAASPRIQALMDQVMERAAEMADDAKGKSAPPKSATDEN